MTRMVNKVIHVGNFGHLRSRARNRPQVSLLPSEFARMPSPLTPTPTGGMDPILPWLSESSSPLLVLLFVLVMADVQRRKGIAAVLRALAALFDPPPASKR